MKYDTSLNNFCLFRIPENGGRVIWEITNQCNYCCNYCIFSCTHSKAKQELGTERALNVIAELKERGFSNLKITGGEPFIRHDIFELLKYASDIGLSIDISTNASLITPEKAKLLNDLKLDMIHVSLDGDNVNIQEQARGKNTFAQTIRGIQNLVKYSNTHIRTGCVIFNGNENRLPQIAEFCCELGVNEIIYSLMEPVGRGVNIKQQLATKSIAELKEIINSINIPGIKINRAFAEPMTESHNNALCPGGTRFLSINSSGVVSPCTWVTEHLSEYEFNGNLNTDSLSKIIGDSEYTSLARDLQKSCLGVCPAKRPDAVRKVSQIKNIVGDKPIDKFAHNAPTYLYSTENLCDALPKLNPSGKNILTIGASGDHFLNFELLGAKRITEFDKNRLAEYVSELKRVASKHLSLHKFKSIINDTDFLGNIELYNRIRPYLSVPAKYLFDDMTTDKSKRILKSYLLPEQNLYTKSDAHFECLKSAQSENGGFIWSDITKLSEKLTECYDLIYLSNISDYAHKMFNDNYLAQFNDQIIRSLLPFIKQNGELVIGYVYDILDKNKSSKRSNINIKSDRKRAFANVSGFEYREEYIKSILDEKNLDALLILKRIKDGKEFA